MTQLTCTQPERADIALPMSGDPEAWEMRACFTDLEYIALSQLLNKITFDDIKKIISRASDDDPNIDEMIEHTHMALIELDGSLELAADLTVEVQ